MTVAVAKVVGLLPGSDRISRSSAKNTSTLANPESYPASDRNPTRPSLVIDNKLGREVSHAGPTDLLLAAVYLFTVTRGLYLFLKLLSMSPGH